MAAACGGVVVWSAQMITPPDPGGDVTAASATASHVEPLLLLLLLAIAVVLVLLSRQGHPRA